MAQTSQTVVVTGTRTPQPAETSPLDLRVIDRAQIERAGSTDLPTLLQRLAGIDISANGGPGQPVGLFLRGSNSSHVVLLVDGVRLGSATTGTSAFEQLALAQIERIEVLTGPASGLYGADAIGGVVQVFTRRAEGLSARLGLGSEKSRSASAALGLRGATVHGGLSLSHQQVDAASATNADNSFSFDPDRDPHRSTAVAGHVEADWATGQTLALRLNHSDSKTHFDAGLGTDDRNHQRLATLALESRNRVNAGWSSLLRLARGSDALRVEGGFPGRFDTRSDQLAWQNELQAMGGQVVTGLEWRRESVNSDTAYTTTVRRVASAFAGWSGAPAAGHQLQLALRHDHDSQFGGHATGNLGWLFDLAGMAPGWQVSAAAGSAFKAPSFNDLYYPLQFGYSGNPALDPERSRSIEAGLRWRGGAWRAGARVFDNRIRDLIVINDSFSTVNNLARAHIRGLVLNAGWAAGPWAARAEATLQSAEDASSGNRLVRRAERLGSAGLDWAAGPWRAGAELVAAGDRFNDGANTDRLGGWALVNLHAGWSPRPGWQVEARIDNAADRAYTLVRGYDVPGRRIGLNLSWQGN